MGAGAESSDREAADQVAPALIAASAVPDSASATRTGQRTRGRPLATDDAAQGSAAATPAASPRRPRPLVPAERLYLEPVLTQAARDYNLPVDLILAQAWAESGWRVDAVSHKGAVGVLQIMPKAADFISTRLLKLDQPLDRLDPAPTPGWAPGSCATSSTGSTATLARR